MKHANEKGGFNHYFSAIGAYLLLAWMIYYFVITLIYYAVTGKDLHSIVNSFFLY